MKITSENMEKCEYRKKTLKIDRYYCSHMDYPLNFCSCIWDNCPLNKDFKKREGGGMAKGYGKAIR